MRCHLIKLMQLYGGTLRRVECSYHTQLALSKKYTRKHHTRKVQTVGRALAIRKSTSIYPSVFCCFFCMIIESAGRSNDDVCTCSCKSRFAFFWFGRYSQYRTLVFQRWGGNVSSNNISNIYFFKWYLNQRLFFNGHENQISRFFSSFWN